MFGLSLRFDLLLGITRDSALIKLSETFSGLDGLLTAVKNEGIQSVELRALFPEHKPSDALKMAENVWKNGMQITVHSFISSEETAVEDVLNPVSEILKNCMETAVSLNIPIPADVGEGASWYEAK